MQEDKTEAEIRAIVPPDVCISCFHLTRRMQRKYHGNWQEVTERFLPSYIFVETENFEECYRALRRVPTLTKIVGLKEWQPEINGFQGFFPLTEEESAFIEQLRCGQGAAAPGLVDISRIEITEGDCIEILDGPLKGLEGSIKKIDLHRRRALVTMDFLGRNVELYFGIEIVKRL